MSHQNITAEWFVVLSDQQQELLSGGAALPNLVTIGSPSVGPLGRATDDGSNSQFTSDTTLGATSSGPFGSIGNSVGQGNGGSSGAEDSMILPPFKASTEIFS